MEESYWVPGEGGPCTRIVPSALRRSASVRKHLPPTGMIGRLRGASQLRIPQAASQGESAVRRCRSEWRLRQRRSRWATTLSRAQLPLGGDTLGHGRNGALAEARRWSWTVNRRSRPSPAVEGLRQVWKDLLQWLSRLRVNQATLQVAAQAAPAVVDPRGYPSNGKNGEGNGAAQR